MSGLVNRPTLGLQIGQMMGKPTGVTDRTVIRYERAGMPFIAVGAMRLYDPVKVREWLLTHERSHAAPRRGRPAKKAS
jgi:hypothetical protein